MKSLVISTVHLLIQKRREKGAKKVAWNQLLDVCFKGIRVLIRS